MLGTTAIAAALTMTTITSCSSESDNIIEEQPVVVTPQQEGVRITVSAGISDDDATTRSEVGRNDAGNRMLKFTAGDRLYVYGKINASTSLAGYLDIDATTLSNNDTQATFSGTVKAYDISSGTPSVIANYNFGEGDPLALCTEQTAKATLVHKDINTAAISITEGSDVSFDFSKMYADDVETLMKTCLPVTGDYNGTSFTIGCTYPIFNCIFVGFTDTNSETVNLTYKTVTNHPKVGSYSFHPDSKGVGTIAFVANTSTTVERTYELTFGPLLYNPPYGNILSKEMALTNKVYNVVRRYDGSSWVSGTDLSSITADYEAQNGDILTGTLASNVQISIANGAEVVLYNANINGNGTLSGGNAGITCEGDATITLCGDNKVKGFLSDYPGIQAAKRGEGEGEEYTLTIRGSGKLEATGGNNAAGIGSGFEGSCGNITITGGTVSATGGNNAAGIGAGKGLNKHQGAVYSTCGNITISGGTVTATGGQFSAGIGTGCEYSTCGAISISTGVTSVIVNKGEGSDNNIGKGISKSDNYNTCGTVTIGCTGFDTDGNPIDGTVYWDGSAYQNQGDTYLKANQFVYPTSTP